jgi:hypothetical protein
MSWFSSFIPSTNSSLPSDRVSGVSAGHSDARWSNICRLLRMGYKVHVAGSGWNWLRSDEEYIGLDDISPKKQHYTDTEIQNYLNSKNFNINAKNGSHSIRDKNEFIFDFNSYNGHLSRLDGVGNVSDNINNFNSHFLALNYFTYISQNNSSNIGLKKTLEFLEKSKDERFLRPEELNDVVQEFYENISRFPAHTQEAKIATEMANKFIQQYLQKINITDYEKMNQVNSSLYKLIDKIINDNKTSNTKVMEFANALCGSINKRLNASLPQITSKTINKYNNSNFPYFAESIESSCGTTKITSNIKNILTENNDANEGSYYYGMIKDSIEKNDTTQLGNLISWWKKLNPNKDCIKKIEYQDTKLKIFGTEMTFGSEKQANTFNQYLNHIIFAKLPYLTANSRVYSDNGNRWCNIYSNDCCKEGEEIIMYELIRQYAEKGEEPKFSQYFKDLTQENKEKILEAITNRKWGEKSETPFEKEMNSFCEKIHQRLERQKLENERLENERLEKERLERQKLENERLENERLERQKLKNTLKNVIKYANEKYQESNRDVLDSMFEECSYRQDDAKDDLIRKAKLALVYIANLKKLEININQEEKIKHKDGTSDIIPINSSVTLGCGDNYTKTKEITIKKVDSFNSKNLAEIIKDIAIELGIEIKNDNTINISILYNNLPKEYEKNQYKNNSCFGSEKESWMRKIEDGMYFKEGCDIKGKHAYL